jgi:hypothetical protein
MKTMKNLAVWALGMMLTAAMVMGVFTSCTDQDVETYETRQAIPGPDPEGDYRVARSFELSCVSQEQRVDHTGKSNFSFYEEGSLKPVKEFSETLLSWAKISLSPDSVRIGEDAEEPHQTAISINRSYKGNDESDQVLINVSDGRILTIDWRAAHAKEVEFSGESYAHGHDSLEGARLLKPVKLPLTKGTLSSQYVKEMYITKYPVEIKTQGYTGDGKKYGDADLDTLYAYGITKVLADNDTEVKKVGTGVKVLNETQQKDSVVIAKVWKDGHSERMPFNQILNRWLESIERRIVDVNTFDGQEAGKTFSVTYGEEEPVRSDAYWKIYGRKVVITKIVTVDNHSEEVRYTYYQERAEFNYEGISHSFEYVTWNIHNFADNFVIAPISERSGYDQLNYKNEIQSYYLDYVQMADEEITFFKKAEEVKLDSCRIINKKTSVDNSKIIFTGEKLMYFSDGTTKNDGTIKLERPWTSVPESNWLINTDHIGTYVSDNFSVSQTTKKEVKSGNFTLEETTYRFLNHVSGKDNYGKTTIVTRCGYNDGKYACEFDIPSHSVEKGSEATKKTSTESGIDTYTYGCEAVVRYGNGIQRVNLPGTILVDTRTHEHGKVNEVLFTTTENEGRNSYLSVCVIVFEDGFRSIGMTGNGDTDFSFKLTSRVNGINSAVFNGSWIPANAQDLPGEGCMTWFDESGKDIRSYSYVKGNRNGWNNGNNTVIDPRRKGEISEDGYSVTFYLNGNKGKTLVF